MNFTIEEQPSYLKMSFHASKSSNALSLEAARDLASVQKKYSKWKKPVVVTSGHPKMFCSGGNLTDYARLKTKAEGMKINKEITKHLDAFGKWPVVKIAYVNGDVLGGGMEWLARFDFRLCEPHVFLAFWQRKIGLSPGWGGGAVWSRKLGEEQVRKLLLEARPLCAFEALRLRLVDRILPVTGAFVEVERLAEGLSAASVSSLRTWEAKNETKIFDGLWLAEEHKSVLKSWKAKC